MLASNQGWTKRSTRSIRGPRPGSLLGTPDEGPHREEVFVRVGKYGPFLEQGERRASIPDGLPPDEWICKRRWNCWNPAMSRMNRWALHPELRQTDLCQSRPLRTVHPIGRKRRRGKAKPVAAEGHGGRRPDSGNGLQTAGIAANAGRIPRQRTADPGFRWALRSLCEVRKRDSFAAGGCFATWRSHWKRQSHC